MQNTCWNVECEAGYTCRNGRCSEGDCDAVPITCAETGECVYDRSLAPDDACITGFVTFLLDKGVYFRTPTDDEVAHLVEFVQEQVAQEGPDGPTRTQTIVKTVQAAWLTTGALFRREVGGEPDAQGRRHLTDEEFGLALSY